MKAIITPTSIKFYTSDALKQDKLLQILMREKFSYHENTNGYIVCNYLNSDTLYNILLAVCERMNVEILKSEV